MDKNTKSITDAVRSAVERTFQSTVGSAAVGKERAQDLVDEVVRRSGESAKSAGEIGNRIRDAIADLRLATGDDVKQLNGEIESLNRRLDKIESDLSGIKSSSKAADSS